MAASERALHSTVAGHSSPSDVPARGPDLVEPRLESDPPWVDLRQRGSDLSRGHDPRAVDDAEPSRGPSHPFAPIDPRRLGLNDGFRLRRARLVGRS